MRSKAHFKTHPIHPMLVAFPIAFFVGAFIFDLIGYFSGRWAFNQTGYFLTIAGIIGGLAAAVPGILDLTHTVPPESSAKKRGVRHGALNTVVILLFIGVWVFRQAPLQGWILGMEFAALVLLSIAGFMGGTLVYRNQIGVDIRYPFSTKWSEQKVSEEQGRLRLGTIEEMKPGQMKLIHTDRGRIVLAKTEDSYTAFSDYCSHRGGSLAGGALICGTVKCPWHGSLFDVHTGAVQAGPAQDSIKVYPVEEDNGEIFIIV